MGLDPGTALMMLLRWVGELISISALIVLFALIFEVVRNWVVAHAEKR